MRTTKNIAEDLYASYLELAQIVDPTKTQEPPLTPYGENLQCQVNEIFKRLERIEKQLCINKEIDEHIKYVEKKLEEPFPPKPPHPVDIYSSRASRPAWIREDGSVIWEKVPVDTKILTKDIEGTWAKGYFAYYEEGAVYWFKNGATSWSEEKCTWTCDRNAKLA